MVFDLFKQEATQTRIQFVPDDPKLTDRGCYIIGPKDGRPFLFGYNSTVDFRLLESTRGSSRNCQEKDGRSQLYQRTRTKG